MPEAPTCHRCGFSRLGLAFGQPCPECGLKPPIERLVLEGRERGHWPKYAVHFAALAWVSFLAALAIWSPVPAVCLPFLAWPLWMLWCCRALGVDAPSRWTIESDRLRIERGGDVALHPWNDFQDCSVGKIWRLRTRLRLHDARSNLRDRVLLCNTEPSAVKEFARAIQYEIVAARAALEAECGMRCPVCGALRDWRTATKPCACGVESWPATTVVPLTMCASSAQARSNPLEYQVPSSRLGRALYSLTGIVFLVLSASLLVMLGSKSAFGSALLIGMALVLALPLSMPVHPLILPVGALALVTPDRITFLGRNERIELPFKMRPTVRRRGWLVARSLPFSRLKSSAASAA